MSIRKYSNNAMLATGIMSRGVRRTAALAMSSTLPRFKYDDVRKRTDVVKKTPSHI